MPELDISIEVTEAFLGPLVADWNRLAREELEALQQSPLDNNAGVTVSFGGAARTYSGYEYLEFRLEDPDSFVLCCRVEGTCGQMSFQTHHPVVQLQGDSARALQWISAVVGRQRGRQTIPAPR
jgi:hypothetical protein